MASQVEMGIGFVMEALSTSSSSSSITGNYSTNVAKNAYLCDIPVTDDTLPVDDLIDFSTQDGVFDDHLLPQSAEINFTSFPMSFPLFGDGNGQSYNNDSSSPKSGSHLTAFPDDLCIIPSEEAAELEWLSKFVEESFSDMLFTSPGTMVDFSNIIPSSTTSTTNSNPNPSDHYHNAGVFPGRARSKRSRQSEPPSSSSSSTSSSSDSKQRKDNGGKKKNNNSTMTMIMTPGAAAGSSGGGSESVRKCTHCSSEKTPQWRTGPLGPKTLCNACGVRYKSGRLVPEYRPAASPTFVLTQHSNSHRKVMELRRQKEVMFRHQRNQYHRESSLPTTTNHHHSTRSDLFLRDYEVC